MTPRPTLRELALRKLGATPEGVRELRGIARETAAGLLRAPWATLRAIARGLLS